MTVIEIKTAWKKNDPDIARDVQALWDELKLVPRAEREARLKEVVAVVYDGEKALGVSTSRPIDYRSLRASFFYYRAAISSETPYGEIAIRLLSASKDILGAWAREHPDEEIKGILMEFDRETFAPLFCEPVVRRMDFELSLVGHTDVGHQIRVLWFDDARLES